MNEDTNKDTCMHGRTDEVRTNKLHKFEKLKTETIITLVLLLVFSRLSDHQLFLLRPWPRGPPENFKIELTGFNTLIYTVKGLNPGVTVDRVV